MRTPGGDRDGVKGQGSSTPQLLRVSRSGYAQDDIESWKNSGALGADHWPLAVLASGVSQVMLGWPVACTHHYSGFPDSGSYYPSRKPAEGANP